MKSKKGACSRILVLSWMALAIVLPASSEATTVPAGFTDTLITTVPRAISLDFTPDGRMLITTKTGTLRVYEDGTLKTQPAIDLSTMVCDSLERGMLGVAARSFIRRQPFRVPLLHL